MTLMNGLLYSTPFEKLTDVKHSRSYDAQHKDPQKRSLFGYSIVKLEEDIVFYAGWRPDSMNKFHAKAGEYLAQCPMQPPIIIKTWAEVRQEFHVFRKGKV